MEFSIESYLNNTFRKNRIKQSHHLNNLIDFDLTQDNSCLNSFEYVRIRRDTPLNPLRIY